MIRRARAREPKRLRQVRESTIEEKLKRHKNKYRIWRRCVKRLAFAAVVA